jgi:hypothetical protein
MKNVEQFKSSLRKELADYLAKQQSFFAEYEIRILDLDFFPWPWDHGQLIISYLVVGEDHWEEKAQENSEYYTPDWKFNEFNNMFDGHEGHALEELFAEYWEDFEYWDNWDENAEGAITREEMFRHFSSVVKSEPVMSAIKGYNLSKDFKIRISDPRYDFDEEFDVI